MTTPTVPCKRMACAKCSFYLPKEAMAALLEEGKLNLHRMQQEVSLTDDERSAVDDGIQALTKLAERLARERIIFAARQSLTLPQANRLRRSAD